MNVSTKFHGNPSNCCWSIPAWTQVMDWQTLPSSVPWLKFDLRIPPSITFSEFCLSARLLLSASSGGIFSPEAVFPSPVYVCQSAASTRPKKWPLIWQSRPTPLPLHASSEQLDPVVWMQSDSWTSRLPSTLLPPTVCICACDGARHVTAACQSSVAGRPPPEAVAVSFKSLERLRKLHSTLIPLQV